MVSPTSVIFAVLFGSSLLASYRDIDRLSSPVAACAANGACAHPLLRKGGDTQCAPTGNGASACAEARMELWTRTKGPWTSAGSDCTASAPPRALLAGGSGMNFGGGCRLVIPDGMRDRSSARAWEALLVVKLRAADGSEVVVTELPFDLTGRVGSAQRGGAFYIRYGRQPAVIRLVDDVRSVGDPAVRGDGEPYRISVDGGTRYYRPHARVDDLALKSSSRILIGPTNVTASGEQRPPITFGVRLVAVGPFRDCISQQVAHSIRLAYSIGLSDSELDEVRHFLSDDRLYRFAITQVISVAHVTFDVLAFKNDVGFYVGRRGTSGVSSSGLISRLVCSLIIFLYLLDAGGASKVVLVGVGMGVGGDAWKAWRILWVTASRGENRGTDGADGTPHPPSDSTAEYDRIARSHLYLLLGPLIVGTALYSRWASAASGYTHGSTYSWIIGHLADAVYAYGFVGMCPQLYINYRLKSVAHLPMRAMMYKLFNTFVDDVFAVLVEMPMKHRVMTLRDDAVLLVFLYQSWIYRVDKTRANEFGYAYERKGGAVPSEEGMGEQNAIGSSQEECDDKKLVLGKGQDNYTETNQKKSQ